jgi:thioredoxin 1
LEIPGCAISETQGTLPGRSRTVERMATVDITGEQFAATVEGNDIVLVDFWAEWCGPCKQFGPTYSAVSEKHPDVVFSKVDTEAEQQLAAEAGITSIPTLMAFREKVLVFSQPGALNAQQLEQVVDAVKALDMDEVHAHVARTQAEAAAAATKQDGSQLPEF